MGRVRDDALFDVKLVAMGHNTIRGAAGASVLNAELQIVAERSGEDRVIVCKFGGTSVGDAEAIARTASIIQQRRDRQPIVAVVSALGGATNQLLQIAEQARWRPTDWRAAGGGRTARPSISAQTGTAPERNDCRMRALTSRGELSAMFDELAHLAEALRTLGDLTPRSLDAIASLGEQLSSVLVVAAFKQHGLDAEHVDARQVMITDAQFTRARAEPAWMQLPQGVRSASSCRSCAAGRFR